MKVTSYTRFALMDHSELISAKVQSALRFLGLQFSWKLGTPSFRRSKKDFWIVSDEIENYGKFTAVQYNVSFQIVVAIVSGEKLYMLFLPLKNCELHEKHLNNNKIPSLLGAWSENKYKVCYMYVHHPFIQSFPQVIEKKKK